MNELKTIKKIVQNETEMFKRTGEMLMIKILLLEGEGLLTAEEGSICFQGEYNLKFLIGLAYVQNLQPDSVLDFVKSNLKTLTE